MRHVKLLHNIERVLAAFDPGFSVNCFKLFKHCSLQHCFVFAPFSMQTKGELSSVAGGGGGYISECS